MVKVSLDLHDFSVPNNRLDLLLRLKDRYPDFKVSLFTIPRDIKHEPAPNREEELKKIKECLDWIQIIPHGLHHNSAEARKWDYTMFKKSVLPTIRRYLTKDGLPFVKGFCAPHWWWTEGIVKVLDEGDWWGAIDREKRMLPTKKFYRYNTRLHEDYLLNPLKLHGYIDGPSEDSLDKCMEKLFTLPQDTEWHFITDFLSE